MNTTYLSKDFVVRVIWNHRHRDHTSSFTHGFIDHDNGESIVVEGDIYDFISENDLSSGPVSKQDIRHALKEKAQFVVDGEIIDVFVH